MASAPPRPAAQSADKKDMSRTNYNGGITTNLATKLCTYLFQLPLQQTPRLQYQNSVGAPLHWVCTSGYCVHERGGPGVKNKNCVKVVVYMHDTHTGWS
jgi:hypothetical protein